MPVEAESMHSTAAILRLEQGADLDLPFVPPARLLLSTGNR
jgi:hypothetical protein